MSQNQFAQNVGNYIQAEPYSLPEPWRGDIGAHKRLEVWRLQ